jgi:outer membrane protein TolC
LFYTLGIIGTVLLVILGVLMHTVLTEYRAMAKRAGQVDKLKKISVSQNSTLERYETDIAQLSKNLAQIKQLNSRLMILTGLDPEKGENNLGLGGSEEGNPKQ